ncbi:MAG: efflux RND transporter periplasmic adaptor subunit [Campylobacterota bacterium]|nr:efflux RND transporter periplasmic adaptor subunit [Campylobacterota bacterium]
MRSILFILLFTIYGFGAAQPPALVNTAKVTKGVVNPLEQFIGTLNFSKTSQMASSTNGVVQKVNFEAGDSLKKGELMVQIDSDILDAQINSAKAFLETAKLNMENVQKDHNRYSELIKTKAISQKTYDDSFFKYSSAKQNLNSAVAKLDELLINKEKKSIKAPYDCVVVEKNIEVSEWASAGKSIATVVDTSKIDIIFNLPSSYIFKLDMEQNYTVDIKGKLISSKLYASIAKGDRRTRTFPVKFKASVNNSFLYDGMEAKISLPRDKKLNSLTVPRDAVIKRFGQDVIFIDTDGIATMIPVMIVGYTKENAAISAAGLKEGASVVVKGNERIFPNQAIKDLNNK